jgi:hypothetical protein
MLIFFFGPDFILLTESSVLYLNYTVRSESRCALIKTCFSIERTIVSEN